MNVSNAALVARVRARAREQEQERAASGAAGIQVPQGYAALEDSEGTILLDSTGAFLLVVDWQA